MNNSRTSIKDELIKVMASIEITSYDHAVECEDENNSIGEIAYKRFIYLLEAMKKEDFVGFQWTTRRSRIPLLHVFSSSTEMKHDTVRWAFPANEVQFKKKTEEKAALFEEGRRVYFLEPVRMKDDEGDENESAARRREDHKLKKEIRPYVNTLELLLALRAEQAILRAVFFPRGEKTPGALILVSTPKSMSIRLRSVLTIYFANTNVKTIRDLKMNTAEEKEEALIDGFDLYYSIPRILDSSMVMPKPKEERAEKFSDMPLHDLNFSVRTYNSLMRGNVRTLGDLVALTDEELLKIRNLGRLGVCEVREKIDELESRGMLPLPKVKTKGVKKDGPEKDPLSSLDRLIGLSEVKAQARRIAAFARMQQDMKERNMEVSPVAMNMLFTGNPGTAKTTVARIMAEIFYELGLLSSPKIVEVGRADLVGEYVGHTALKVKDVFRRARGTVLFIDEAYSLVDDYKSSYGDEAISTIVQEMENRREETIVIFAGYPDEMRKFMNRNPGLRSRVPFHLSFGDYSAEELGSITELEAERRGFAISETAHAKVIEICGKAAGIGEYGNGRFCRNLVENAIVNFASRVYGTDGKPEKVRFELVADDITMPKSDVPEEKEPRRIGFLPA